MYHLWRLICYRTRQGGARSRYGPSVIQQSPPQARLECLQCQIGALPVPFSAPLAISHFYILNTLISNYSKNVLHSLCAGHIIASQETIRDDRISGGLSAQFNELLQVPAWQRIGTPQAFLRIVRHRFVQYHFYVRA